VTELEEHRHKTNIQNKSRVRKTEKMIIRNAIGKNLSNSESTQLKKNIGKNTPQKAKLSLASPFHNRKTELIKLFIIIFLTLSTTTVCKL
jgi:hypothetical protein